jgi:hypothetical protein
VEIDAYTTTPVSATKASKEDRWKARFGLWQTAAAGPVDI